jgi:hypothetical protein
MSNKKKIVLLVTGQLRTFDDPVVVKSWEKFFDQYDVTTFVCCWNNRGRSIGGTPANINVNDGIDENEIISINHVKNVFKTDNVKLFDFNEWLNSNQIKDWMKVYRENQYFNCTFPCNFLRKQAGDMLKAHLEKNDEKYDGAFLTRPDLYLMRKPFQNQYFSDTEFVFHQNSSHNFHPNRVYDIFLFSSVKNILKICEWYDSEYSVPSVINNVNNCLHPLDSCRVIWIYSNLIQLQIKSFENPFAEVFRNILDVRLLMQRYYPRQESVWCLDE